ncbi:RUS1 family protein C16orf58 homolog isoform X2 [Anoplophora glabripennis]|uniref:RUS1 family protein C16orf58 homolog isoform X2 n=1 Tax=Anoplophora glabripennis TaxID=217634 RepID=UPI0008740844|nr:RUS1 family protein C16orf58 homolog isoform X2 [Anoplophora glabripennis]
MSEHDIIITEQCSSLGDKIYYARKGRNGIVHVKHGSVISLSFQWIKNFFREVLLPYGYPDSVSDDYLHYQLWDTAQAFCSTITNAFTTRAVLKGVGVGDPNATALSAAITWIMKEGTGMIGRILFAWWKGNGLDSDCKKWRLFADTLNDAAMVIELTVPFFSNFSMPILCTTSTMKSIVGVAGGATRASITHHQAIKDNMAEVSAKDGSQETLVNLVASLASIYLLNTFDGTVTEWILIFCFMFLHLVANYCAMKSLKFRTFNNQRMAIVLKTYYNVGTVLSPQKVNEKESIFLGFGSKVSDFCGFNILMGESTKQILLNYSFADFQETLSVYKDKTYFILADIYKRQIYICFESGETTETVLEAYFHSVCLGIATCIYNEMDLDIYSKRHLRHPTPITRLYTFMKSYEKSITIQNIPHNYLLDFNDFVKQEYYMFYTALDVNGWNLDTHSLSLGEWRTDWKTHSRKNV